VSTGSSARARSAGLGFALCAFAGNSILCRLALRGASIDAVTFTSVRLCSGALTLMLLLRATRGEFKVRGDWLSAVALLSYAAAFSFSYVSIATGTGALLLFGTVQLVMIGAGVSAGERLRRRGLAGWTAAVSGVVLLMLPGVSAAPLSAAVLMLGAGAAWAMYSLRGRLSKDPLSDTAGNFLRAAPVAAGLSLVRWRQARFDSWGVILAAISGCVTSGLGYAVWYAVLPRLTAITAANAQLAVPVIAAFAGVALFAEPAGWRLATAAGLVIGGIWFSRTRGAEMNVETRE
jgi:drug/metabolite transporter (DMT)-like permease